MIIITIILIMVITCALVWRSEVESCGKVQELRPLQRYNRRPRRILARWCDQCILWGDDGDDDDDAADDDDDDEQKDK